MFPNPSRSYDETQGGIRFVGHDGMFEIPFFVEVAALAAKTIREGGGEREYLAAFDAARDTIRSVALEIYARARKKRYVLTAADFQ